MKWDQSLGVTLLTIDLLAFAYLVAHDIWAPVFP